MSDSNVCEGDSRQGFKWSAINFYLNPQSSIFADFVAIFSTVLFSSCNTHYKIVSSQDSLSKTFPNSSGPLTLPQHAITHTQLPATLSGQHSTGTQFPGRARAGKTEALLVFHGCSCHCKCVSWGVPSRGEKICFHELDIRKLFKDSIELFVIK